MGKRKRTHRNVLFMRYRRIINHTHQQWQNTKAK